MIDAPPIVLLAIMLVFPLVQLAAMAEDLWRMTISNILPFILVIGFVLFALLSPFIVTEIVFRLVFGIGLFAVGTIGFARGMLGGGDVKLLAASAPWVAPLDAGLYLLVMALSGGALAIAAAIYRKLKLPAPFGLAWLDHSSEETGIPYGIAIGIAGLWAFSMSKTFQPFWSML